MAFFYDCPLYCLAAERRLLLQVLNMMNKTIHFMVSGRVQGVFFRASTREEAKKLGLSVWVRNLPDGRVEGRASGPKAALKALELWLQQGPPMAEVTTLQIREVEDSAPNDFDAAPN